ncbi:AF4/FMR2 family member 3-like [Saccoglossus kowalevskii]
MQQQTVYTNYLLSSHDLWEQADELQKENEEFFRGLDIECGHLTFHSSILDLVRYVRLGLHRLRSIATGL